MLRPVCLQDILYVGDTRFIDLSQAIQPTDQQIIESLHRQARAFGLNPDNYATRWDLEDAIQRFAEDEFRDNNFDPHGDITDPDAYDRAHNPVSV